MSKIISIQEFCSTPGKSQNKAAALLGIHQTTVSKMIRKGRIVYLEFTDDDQFVRAFDDPKPRVYGPQRA